MTSSLRYKYNKYKQRTFTGITKRDKMQVEKESKSVGLEKEDALNRARWRVGVGEIAVRVG